MRDKLEMTRKHRYDQRRNHEQELKGIATAYNKSRTQMFTHMDEKEIAMHELKMGIERMNAVKRKEVGLMERDLEEAVGGADGATPRTARRGRSQQPQ